MANNRTAAAAIIQRPANSLIMANPKKLPQSYRAEDVGNISIGLRFT